MFGHVVQADKIATVSAAGARCEVEGGLSMNKNFFFKKNLYIVFIMQFLRRGRVVCFCWWEFLRGTY